MTLLLTPPETAPATTRRPVPPRRRRVLSAGVRVLAVVALYLLYAYARNAHGSASIEDWQTAQRHAAGLVGLQEALGLPPERDLQAAVLGFDGFVRACGAFYGTAHFAVTAAVLLWLGVRRADQLARLGTTLVASTFAAVAVFALHPVAPPRLMPEGQQTVDTLAVVGGLWSYDHGVLERISDPFAALPSLHLGWATWCAVVVWVLSATARRRTAWRCVAVAYPVLTLVSVLVTGNHWYVDAVAGTALVLGVVAVQAVVAGRVGPRA